MSRILIPCVASLLIACCAETVAAQKPTVVFLVRHAEKVDDSDDSKLSAAGEQRSARLAGILRDANIEHVHSTDFIRTRDTASPVAKARNIEVTLYDGGDLPAMAEKLKSTGGRHLVVGHSNTTPKLVELLGGKPGTKIDEKEYDRLYIVTIGSYGTVSTVLMRF